MIMMYKYFFCNVNFDENHNHQHGERRNDILPEENISSVSSLFIKKILIIKLCIYTK